MFLTTFLVSLILLNIFKQFLVEIADHLPFFNLLDNPIEMPLKLESLKFKISVTNEGMKNGSLFITVAIRMKG